MTSSNAHASRKINVFQLSHKNILTACTIKRVKNFLNAIKSMSFSNNTELEFSDTGLKFTVEESQFFQGVVFFSKEFFEKYYFSSKLRNNNEIVRFGVNLNAVAEFFGALIDNDTAVLKITYYGIDRPIAFIFSQKDIIDDKNEGHTGNTIDDESLDNEIITEYIIKIKNSINPIDFSGKDFKILSSVELEASYLMDIIQDLDKMIEEVTIKVEANVYMFKSLVNMCRTQIPFAADHKIFKSYKFTEASQFSYKFACFKSMLKSLAICTMACLDTLENGLLKISLLSNSFDENKSLFYEFNIMPSFEDDVVEIE